MDYDNRSSDIKKASAMTYLTIWAYSRSSWGTWRRRNTGGGRRWWLGTEPSSASCPAGTGRTLWGTS